MRILLLALLGVVAVVGTAPPAAECQKYCDALTAACSVYLPAFNCLGACSQYQYTGLDLRMYRPWMHDDNTFECRMWHTSLMSADHQQPPPLYCAIASPTGGTACHSPTTLAGMKHYGAMAAGRQAFWSGSPNQTHVLAGALHLASQRTALVTTNLVDEYTDAEGAALDATLTCSPEAERFRTPNGQCNRLDKPHVGMTGTKFGRNFHRDLSESLDEAEARLYNPPPFKIAELSERKDKFKRSFLNLLTGSWLQFQFHDWGTHFQDNEAPPMKVPLDGGEHMYIPRTKFNDDRTMNNGVTHWWDASMVYGSNKAEQDALRTFEDGKFTVTDEDLLPVDEEGLPMSGFTGSWWVGLEMLHTLFVREHNCVCDAIKAEHPDMSDEELFQTARLVVSALLAKIQTVEWTPAILANPALDVGMNANWYGLRSVMEAWGVPEEQLVKAGFPPLAALELIPGIKGIKTKAHDNGVPYSITEEFVGVYRMHPLIPDYVNYYAKDGTGERVRIEDTMFKRSRKMVEEKPMEDLFRMFGQEFAGALEHKNFPDWMTNHKLYNGRVMNLAVMDIMRDRERGVPRYNELRRMLGLETFDTIEDINADPVVIADLKAAYGDKVEDVDLMPGLMAESRRPSGYGFGETAFTIFVVMTSRRLQTDRFFQEAFNEEHYTKVGLDWVRHNTMSGVLCRHFPSLEPFVKDLKTAFHPWPQCSACGCSQPFKDVDEDGIDDCEDPTATLCANGRTREVSWSKYTRFLSRSRYTNGPCDHPNVPFCDVDTWTTVERPVTEIWEALTQGMVLGSCDSLHWNSNQKYAGAARVQSHQAEQRRVSDVQYVWAAVGVAIGAVLGALGLALFVYYQRPTPVVHEVAPQEMQDVNEALL